MAKAVPMHAHLNKNGIPCGKPHPSEANHKNPKTQDAHYRTMVIRAAVVGA